MIDNTKLLPRPIHGQVQALPRLSAVPSAAIPVKTGIQPDNAHQLFTPPQKRK